jgi:predicted methyltransferase
MSLTADVLVLHSHYKLQYFKKASWENDWIDTALDLVCKMFDRFYTDPAETVGNCEALVKRSVCSVSTL